MAKRRKGKGKGKGKSSRKGNDRKRNKRKRRKVLARVTADNKVTRSEQRKLRKLGISSNKTRNFQINKSRGKTTNRRKNQRRSASVTASQNAYVPLKIKGGGWDGGSRKSGSGSNRSSSGAPRDTGKFVDIRNALREDAAAGQSAASDLSNQDVSQASAYETLIADLQAQTAASEAAYQEQLTQQAEASAASLANLNDLFVGQMDSVEARMAQQQQDFNTAQAFADEQLNAANNAFLAEQRRSANMANAYVPQANPTASSIGYGDGRRANRRRRQDNQLSDLTLLSGLGTTKSPLAGLQLA
jgi:hypothetical protein